MSKQDFVFAVDARHFSVTSRLHHNKLYTPCAYLRPSTSNGKTDFDKVLIFFEKSVANELNRWMPGYLKQSQTTGRWYTPVRTEDIYCTNTGSFDRVRSFLRKAAAKSNDMDSDFPIKHLYFLTVDDYFALVPKLRDIVECDGAFEDKGIKIPLPTPQKASIHKIVFNGPATVVFWTDGTKTVVRYNDETETIDDREKAVFAACAKKILGTNATGSNYLDRIKPAFDAAQEEWAKRIVKEEADNA